MKAPLKITSILAAFLAATSAFATTSDVVGYVTFNAPDGADQKFGIPMTNSPEAHTISSISSGTINVSSDPSAATTNHYIQFTGGTLEGQWFQVTASDSSTVTVAEDLESLGAIADDSFDIVEAWTLSTLFGSDFPVSTDVFSPVAQVLANDVTAVGINKSAPSNYAYHDGSSGFVGAGWFNVNNPFDTSKDSVILAPNTFITIRNQTGSDFDIVIPGAVPNNKLSIAVVADSSQQNDNLIYNPYPADIQLSLSDLTSVVATSTDVFTPTDQIIVYSSTPTGLNPSASSNYAYHDGSSGFVGAGWFNVNNPFDTSKDTVTIPAGGAFIIRKAAGGSDGYWAGTLPYTL